MWEGQTIVLCKNFTYVGANGDAVTFDWHQIDASFTNADVVIDAKAVEAGTLAVAVVGSTDGALLTSLGSTNVNAIGPVTFAITGLLPYARLVLTASGAAARQVLSVTLILKHT